MDVAVSALEDLAAWQRVIDGYAPLFEPLATGVAVGLAPRFFVDAIGTRRSTAMPSTPMLSMIEWRKCDQGMRAQPGTYDGLARLGVDLLFLAGDGALEAVLARAEHPLGEMKRQLRAARIQFFVFRTTRELRDLGYEDFVEALGLPFLGACR
ncbi:MAG TPA: hypothetical protein VLC47_02930 [Burkholderiales bacterium]|nr:hypothetical protein [Burkholderiales bacterium]